MAVERRAVAAGRRARLGGAARTSAHGSLAAVLALAAALDLVAGEPPTRLHPVVWIGTFIERSVGQAPAGQRAALLYGAALALGTPALAAAAALLVERAAQRLPTPLGNGVQAAALKPAFALRALLAAAERVERPLRTGELEAARRELRALVSRETSELDESLVAAAAIESLAENLGDGLAGPLLAYALGGLPGAWAYRAVNTLDSMVGYRGRFEYLGKASARLDDLLNLLPARLAALALLATAPLFGGSVRGGLRALRHDRARTASPNAGWPMSVTAGVLGVRLEKRGHYTLNPSGRPPDIVELRRARTLTAAAGALLLVLGVCGATLRGRWLARAERKEEANRWRRRTAA